MARWGPAALFLPEGKEKVAVPHARSLWAVLDPTKAAATPDVHRAELPSL